MPETTKPPKPVERLLDSVNYEYTEETFHEKSEELLKIIRALGFEMKEPPCKVAGQWITYLIGVARKEGSPVVISWKLQDDGDWTKAYVVVDIERFVKFHPDDTRRFGGPSIVLGALRLYPDDFKYIGQVVKRLEEFDLSPVQV